MLGVQTRGWTRIDNSMDPCRTNYDCKKAGWRSGLLGNQDPCYRLGGVFTQGTWQTWVSSPRELQGSNPCFLQTQIPCWKPLKEEETSPEKSSRCSLTGHSYLDSNKVSWIKDLWHPSAIRVKLSGAPPLSMNRLAKPKPTWTQAQLEPCWPEQR